MRFTRPHVRSSSASWAAAPTLLALGALGAVSLAACKHDGRYLRPPKPGQNATIYTPSTTTTSVPTTFSFNDGGGGVTTPATVDIASTPIDSTDATDSTDVAAAIPFALELPWQDGGAIDAKFTCKGTDVHPQIAWLGAPAAAVEMALVVRDTDANFIHWIIAGLDPKNPLVGEGVVPTGAVEGQNGFSTAATPSVGWKGPCPPAGTTHHYQFTLYALSQQVELPTGSTAADMQAVIDASTIEATSVTGIFPGP